MLAEPVEPTLADTANHFYEGQCQFQQTMQTGVVLHQTGHFGPRQYNGTLILS